MRSPLVLLGATTAVITLAVSAIIPMACQAKAAPCQTVCDCLQWEDPDACVEQCEGSITDVAVCLAEYADTGCQQHCGAFGVSDSGGGGGGGISPGHASTQQGDGCVEACDYCWFDSTFEDDCPASFEGTDDGCDCGCQFDDPDCDDDGGEGEAEAEGEGDQLCDYCWAGDCLEAYRTDSTCDCGCQFDDEACPGVDPEPDCPSFKDKCPDYCDICYLGTATEGNCDLEWDGDGSSCDCGCQFIDDDCSDAKGC
jgi:hypothetical protein